MTFFISPELCWHRKSKFYYI